MTGSKAHFILAIPAPVSAPSATVCTSSAACDALLPPSPPAIVRRLDEEAWVVVATPAGMVATVTSDGAAAVAALEPACPPAAAPKIEARLVLYRVAPTVAKATYPHVDRDVPARALS